MFEAKLTQGVLLKKLVEAIKDLVTEVNFEVNENGLDCQAMDTSHVCLLSIHMANDGFEHFRCDRPLSLGLNLKFLGSVLKCMGNDDVVVMRAEDDASKLSLVFEDPSQNRTASFEVPLMDIQQEQLGIPEQDYACQVKMSASEYQRIVRDLSGIGETVTISVTKDGIKFAATGDITASIVCRHNPNPVHDGKKKGEAKPTIIEMNEPVSLNFAMRYLVNFSKAAPLSENVTLTLTRDLPVQVEFMLEGIGHVRFYLAPKIEDEEMQEGAEGGGDA